MPKTPLLDNLKCSSCKDFKTIDNSNYGLCKITKEYVYEGKTFCDSGGRLDPSLWFMQEPNLSHYLKLESDLNIKLLPKPINRTLYKPN